MVARNTTVALVAGLLAAVALALPTSASAEQATYESGCVLPASQRAATQCPAGAKAISGGTGKVPASRLTAGTRQPEPTKRAAATGPDISDTIVQQARSGFREKRQQERALLMQEIELTKRLIKNTRPNDPEMPPRRLRLAQSYEDLLQEARSSVRELDDPIHEARRAGQKAQAEKLVRDQRQREEGVTRWRDEAIQQYAALAKNHPDYRSRDEVLFRLAFMIEEQAADDRLRNEIDGRPVPSKARIHGYY